VDPVPSEWWKLSAKWAEALASCTDIEHDEGGRIVVQLMDVTKSQWGIIREYLAHHGGRIPAPVRRSSHSDFRRHTDDAWDADFAQRTIDGKGGRIDEVYRLMTSVMQHDLMSLVHLLAAALAHSVRGSDPREALRRLRCTEVGGVSGPHMPHPTTRKRVAS